MIERIYAEIAGNVCVRRFWARYDGALPAGVVISQPWHVEGQDVTASLAAWQAALDAAIAEAGRLQAIEDDPQRIALVNQLKTATNAQIDAYVDAQVTDLASARAMLKRIIKVLALGVDRLT